MDFIFNNGIVNSLDSRKFNLIINTQIKVVSKISKNRTGNGLIYY